MGVDLGQDLVLGLDLGLRRLEVRVSLGVRCRGLLSGDCVSRCWLSISPHWKATAKHAVSLRRIDPDHTDGKMLSLELESLQIWY